VKFERPSREDLIASLVVFIIAVPLSLGIALASGATPAAGLITAVIGGIMAGFLAGAPLGVTGPAAGMTALVFQLIQNYGIDGLAIITCFAGLMQIGLGLARAGKFFLLIPHAVLEGVLTAIGFIILVGQLHVLAGAPMPKSFFDGIVALPASLMGFGPVLICGLIAIGIQLFWNAKMKKLKWIPGALPAVVIVTAISLFWEMPRVELEALLPLVRSSTDRFFAMGWVAQTLTYLAPAFGVAVVASAESLLTARAVDTLVEDRPGFRPANLNRELSAQGAANLFSGALGGLPMTAVMVRSAANVNSGAQTRWSTVLHGVWIATFVSLLPNVISKVPLTALAAVLVLTGYKLLNLPRLVHELRVDRRKGTLWILTSGLVLATDLLTGLVSALALATVMHHREVIGSMKQTRIFKRVAPRFQAGVDKSV
jgi:MFS superfamily sulfate permease-like transporter